MDTLKHALSQFQGQAVMVIGDLMLDEFHWCHVDRISPEAPVPVCKVEKTTYVPGGAGNVAHNICSLGGKVHLAGHMGEDGTAQNLSTVLDNVGISQDCIVVDDTRATILKSRVIAQKQQVVRVDREEAAFIPEHLEYALLQKIEAYLPKVNCIVLSDYGKGTITPSILKRVMETARQSDIRVIVDPKGMDYTKYKGVYAITPNFKEFQEAVGHSLDTEDQILEQGIKMCHDLGLELMVVTRSENGMSIIHKNGEKVDIPTRAREVTDITGAGDTVIASLSLGLAAGLDMESVAQVANYAAGISVSKVGTAVVTVKEIEAVLSLSQN